MELREASSDRARRVAVMVAAVIVAIVLAGMYLRMSEARGAPGCVQAYASARTAADTAAVDVQKADPEPGRVGAAYGVTCGDLRQRGQLR
jgi:hypothetical protein